MPRLSRLAALLFGTAASIATIAGSTAASAEPARVAFLITQPLSPFEEDIWNAVNRAKADGKASEVKLIEMKNPTEYEQTVRQVGEQGYNVVVSTFFFVKEAFNKIAPDLPNTNFVLVYEPNENNYPNMRGILYDVQEGSYVCGVVAGMMSKSGKFGFIGGNDSPGILKFLAGFEAGVQAAKPGAEVDVSFAGTFIDPEKGKEIAISLFDRGDDVVMHAANMTGLGLFAAAKDAGKYAVGVDIDQNGQAPDSVICSALSNPGLSVYRAIADTADGTWTGGTMSWGVDDGAPAAALASWVPDEVRAAAAEAEKNIASGALVPPQSTETR